MKKWLSVLLAASLLLGIVLTVSAADDEAIKAANSLYDLGLFQGTGANADGSPNFALDSGSNTL